MRGPLHLLLLQPVSRMTRCLRCSYAMLAVSNLIRHASTVHAAHAAEPVPFLEITPE